MIILKSLNNNMAIVKGENSKEKVVFGKGITFGKKKGDEINLDSVEKQFDLVEKGMGLKTKNILESVPKIYFQMCDEIINNSSKYIKNDLDTMILISLADHISYAVERQNLNQILTSTVDWEIKNFYPAEYKVGLMALDIIEKRINVRLDKSEATYIAFHFINAQPEASNNIKEQMNMIYDILRLIQFELGLEIEPHTITYNRLVNHLKYLCHKVSQDIHEKKEAIVSMNDLEGKYKNEVNCVKKISDMLYKQYHYKLSEADKVYLVMHMFRIII